MTGISKCKFPISKVNRKFMKVHPHPFCLRGCGGERNFCQRLLTPIYYNLVKRNGHLSLESQKRPILWIFTNSHRNYGIDKIKQFKTSLFYCSFTIKTLCNLLEKVF